MILREFFGADRRRFGALFLANQRSSRTYADVGGGYVVGRPPPGCGGVPVNALGVGRASPAHLKTYHRRWLEKIASNTGASWGWERCHYSADCTRKRSAKKETRGRLTQFSFPGENAFAGEVATEYEKMNRSISAGAPKVIDGGVDSPVGSSDDTLLKQEKTDVVLPQDRPTDEGTNSGCVNGDN